MNTDHEVRTNTNNILLYAGYLHAVFRDPAVHRYKNNEQTKKKGGEGGENIK